MTQIFTAPRIAVMLSAVILSFLIIPFSHAATTDLDAAFRILSRDDRSDLRRYLNQGSCPITLKRSTIPHFYELCVEQLRQKTKNTTVRGGFMNDRIATRYSTGNQNVPRTKLRMEMIRQAKDPTTRRTDIKKQPGRPLHIR